MQYNAFDIFFIGLSFAGIIVGLMILSHRKTPPLRLPLAFVGWIIGLILHLGFFLVHLNQILPAHHVLNFWGFPLALFHLPLLYLAIRHLALNKKPGLLEIFLHLLPYLTYTGWLLYLNQRDPQSLALIGGFFDFTESTPLWFRREYGSLIALSGFAYSFLVGRVYLQFRKDVKQHFSNTTDLNLTWILFLSIYLVGLFLGIYVIISLCPSGSDCPIPTFKGVSMYLSMFLIFFAIRYQQQREVLLSHQYTPHPHKLSDSSSLSEKETFQLQVVSEQVHALLKREKSYLDPELTLPQLSNQLDLSPQIVSRAINTQLQTNFYQLVNGYRIQYAQQLLTNPAFRHYSVLGIAQESGFKSKSTFYKLFRERIGITPSEYRKKEQPGGPPVSK